MGRWAQRRLGNGGGGSGPAPILITEALVVNALTGLLTATFSGDILDSDFNAADFEVSPAAVGAAGVGQNASNSLDIVFGFDITGQTDLDYFGTAPNVATPQTVPLT